MRFISEFGFCDYFMISIDQFEGVDSTVEENHRIYVSFESEKNFFRKSGNKFK